MIRLMHIDDADSFLRIVDMAKGSVLMQIPGSEPLDIKHDRAARALLHTVKPGRNGIRLSLSDPSDLLGFIRGLAMRNTKIA